MALQRLEKTSWTSVCELLSAELLGKWAEIEIASYELGVQIESRSRPVMGLTYDSRDDLIELVLEGHDHMVLHPREVYADFGAAGLESLGIVDGSGNWQIILLRDPLMLPSPRR